MIKRQKKCVEDLHDDRSNKVPRATLFVLEPTLVRDVPHMIRGVQVLLPGSYASVNLLGAYLGWPGYDYNSIPSYDD